MPKIQIGSEHVGLDNRYFTDPLVDAADKCQGDVDAFFAHVNEIAHTSWSKCYCCLRTKEPSYEQHNDLALHADLSVHGLVWEEVVGLRSGVGGMLGKRGGRLGSRFTFCGAGDF